MNAVEAIKIVNGKPVYTRHPSNPRDFEKQRFPLLKGEINTHLRHGQSMATRGRPDAYSYSQKFRPLKGLVGPIPARQNLGGDDNGTVNFRVYAAFKRPHDIPTDFLDSIKSADFDGSADMINDAAEYLAGVIKHTHFDAVCPVTSSKPLASMLAEKISDISGIRLLTGVFSKVGTAKDTAASKRGQDELFKFSSTSIEVPDNVLLVDDFVTTRQSLVEMARKLYSAGARYVAAVVLCGSAQGDQA